MLALAYFFVILGVCVVIYFNGRAQQLACVPTTDVIGGLCRASPRPCRVPRSVFVCHALHKSHCMHGFVRVKLRCGTFVGLCFGEAASFRAAVSLFMLITCMIAILIRVYI